MSSISSGPCWATRTAVAHHLSARRYAPHGPVWPSRPRSPAPAAVDRPFDPRPRSATSALSRNSPFQPAEPQWGPLSTEYCTSRVNPLPSADETAVSPCTLGLVSHAIPVCPVSATITHPRLGTHPPSEVTFPVGCQDPIRLWASQEVTPPGSLRCTFMRAWCLKAGPYTLQSQPLSDTDGILAPHTPAGFI